MDAAELELAFGTALECAEDIEHVGNDHSITAALALQNFSVREHAGDIAEPALQHFDINSEREHVEPADLDLLPPMRGRFGIEIRVGETLQPHIVQTADVIFGQ